MKIGSQILVFTLVIGLTLAGSVSAATPSGSITDGGVVFTYTGSTDTFSAANTPTVNLTLSGLTGDQMYAFWWWYRLTGDTMETIFPDPDSLDFSGNPGEMIWSNVNGEGFEARLLITVTDTGGGTSGTVQQSLTITNTSDIDPLAIDVFAFADMDVGGDLTDDSATLGSTNRIIDITDGGSATTGQFSTNFTTNTTTDTPPYGAYEVATFNGVATALDDGATVTNLANSGLPFGPQDFTGAMQEHRVIPATGVHTYVAGVGINDQAPTAVNLTNMAAAERSAAVLWPAIVLTFLLVTAVLFMRGRRRGQTA